MLLHNNWDCFKTSSNSAAAVLLQLLVNPKSLECRENICCKLRCSTLSGFPPPVVISACTSNGTFGVFTVVSGSLAPVHGLSP